jgi:hypothetical protein
MRVVQKDQSHPDKFGQGSKSLLSHERFEKRIGIFPAVACTITICYTGPSSNGMTRHNANERLNWK